MPQFTTCSWISTQPRRGAITVLTAVTLPVLLVLAAFAINVAYMQMVREQLRVACDASAKAALINYGSAPNTTTAIAFAQTIANCNPVAGNPLALSATNVLFGTATKGSGGVYAFTQGGSPTNSVQVNGSISTNLFLGTFMPVQTFSPAQTSVVTRIAHDLVLVLDRSSSMAFDLSVNEFSYPDGGMIMTDYFSPPSATNSRWAALAAAVNSFITVIQARNIDINVGLVTYANTYSFGAFSATASTLDVQLTSNYSLIPTAMNGYAASPLLGDTYIYQGLLTAGTELTGPRARTTADRTMILLTDGVATINGPVTIPAATLAARQSYDIITHVITFSAESATTAVQSTMQNAAANGNGMYFYAPTASQLQTAFTTIADSLPAVLIQ